MAKYKMLEHPEPPSDWRERRTSYVQDSKWYTKWYREHLGPEWREERHPDPQWRRWRGPGDKTLDMAIAHNSLRFVPAQPAWWVLHIPAHSAVAGTLHGYGTEALVALLGLTWTCAEESCAL
jgi:hypothetical protein